MSADTLPDSTLAPPVVSSTAIRDQFPLLRNIFHGYDDFVAALEKHPQAYVFWIAVAVIFCTALYYLLFRSRFVLMFRAKRGSMFALYRLTYRLLRRHDADVRQSGTALLNTAADYMPSAMYDLGVKIAAANDKTFRQDAAIARLWMKKAASWGDAETHAQMEKSGAIVHDPHDNSSDPYQELESMIGLEVVKREIREVADRARLFELRKTEGLKVSQPALHLVFLGNPGTGKTTVARILGRLLKKVGYLSRGHVVEVSESDMIGQYIGETAIKTQRKMSEAKGGILFIDEAYSIMNATGTDGKGSFSASAIATLLKFMEDMRDDLVVIAAGYPKEMEEFLDSNPGLRSRFTGTIAFPDYDDADMVEIFLEMARTQEYTLTAEAKTQLPAIIATARTATTRNFGNGRYVRMLFENAVRYLAIRLSGVKNPSRAQLMDMQAEDISKALEHMRDTRHA